MSKTILTQVKELIPPLTGGLHKGQAGKETGLNNLPSTPTSSSHVVARDEKLIVIVCSVSL
ncbi:hypothetical protein FRC14_006742 [Serendipita sp. 396]|nr:hypothetical protein FRC14_006742 [Serendipita sp. 396]